MLTRRAALLRMVNAERWDDTILPNNGAETGYFTIKRYALTTGQIITLKYSGVTSRSSGHCFADGYFARTTDLDGTTHNLFYCSQLVADSGTVQLKAGKDGSITIGNTRNAEDGSGSVYTIREIKVRID